MVTEDFFDQFVTCRPITASHLVDSDCIDSESMELVFPDKIGVWVHLEGDAVEARARRLE
jgi:hypothetical protein